MSDYDILKEYILASGYKIQTDIDNIIWMCFAHYENELEDNETGKFIPELNLDYAQDCIEFVKQTGLRDFDYYC